MYTTLLNRNKIFYSFGLSMIACILIRLPYIFTTPIWDSQGYYNNCFRLSLSPINFLALNCGDHPSIAYFGLFVLPEKFMPWHYSTVLILNTVLYGFVIYLFLCIYEILSKNKPTFFDVVLFALTLAISPFLQANTLLFHPDIGVLFYFTIFFYSLFSGTIWLAFVGAVGMIFSKETGSVLFLLTLVYWWNDIHVKLNYEIKKLLLLFSASLIIVYLTYRWFLGVPLLWNTSIAKINGSNYFSIFDHSTYMVFMQLFVMNFHWLILLVITIFITCSRKKTVDSSTKKMLFFLLLLALFFSRYKTYSNSRYLLPFYPILFLTFYLYTKEMIIDNVYRYSIQSFFIIASLISCFYSIDPVQKKILGTFSFGSHSMLNMTSLTGECCGYGRDQLVYNLQFFNFTELMNKLYQTTLPSPDTVFFVDAAANWYLDAPINKKTYQLSYFGTDYLFPHFASFITFSEEKHLPHDAYFIFMPNVRQTSQLSHFKSISRYFKKKEFFMVEKNGYQLKYAKLSL